MTELAKHSLNMTAKYYIYRNLHTGGFSVKYRGLVIDRGFSFTAENITFKVNELGRQKVIAQRHKDVHAYVVADKYNFNETVDVDNLEEVTYNPYKFPYFLSSGKKIENAKKVAFSGGKCYLIE